MESIKANEINEIIRAQIENFDASMTVDEVGTVVPRFAPPVDGESLYAAGNKSEALKAWSELAAKHAGSSASVTVVLQREADELAFSVHDSGRGFDAETQQKRRTITKEYTTKATESLTADQKAAWKDLTGAPFELKMDANAGRRPGGEGGDTPRRRPGGERPPEGGSTPPRGGNTPPPPA